VVEGEVLCSIPYECELYWSISNGVLCAWGSFFTL